MDLTSSASIQDQLVGASNVGLTRFTNLHGQYAVLILLTRSINALTLSIYGFDSSISISLTTILINSTFDFISFFVSLWTPSDRQYVSTPPSLISSSLGQSRSLFATFAAGLSRCIHAARERRPLKLLHHERFLGV